MQRSIASLFLHYARLDRKRSVEGLSASEAERLAQLRAELTSALLPHVPSGAERRDSIRVPAELPCHWAPVPRGESARITTISRTGAFIRTPTPAPVGEDIAISIALPAGGQLQVPGSVANQILGPDPDRRGMGVRFGRLEPETRARIDELYELSIVRHFGSPDEAEPPTSG